MGYISEINSIQIQICMIQVIMLDIMLDVIIPGVIGNTRSVCYCLNVYASCIESEQLRFYHALQLFVENNVADDHCLLVVGGMKHYC